MCLFEEICAQAGLGKLTCAPRPLSGGLMHQMFCVTTDAGAYAVKLLNPAIMARPDAAGNYLRAERLEEKLAAAGIPVVPAKVIRGVRMQSISGRFYYVFDYVRGSALSPEDVRVGHCRRMGDCLASIHGIDFRIESAPITPMQIDWDAYISLARAKNNEIAPPLAAGRALLYESQNAANRAQPRLARAMSITNGDMDRKNVLWMGEEPYIIDLECLSTGHPYLEMFGLGLCWAGYDRLCLNMDLLEAFLSAYLARSGARHMDWDVLYACYNDRLYWLEYNIRRALGLECAGDAEARLGVSQVLETLALAEYYRAIGDELIDTLSRRFP